MVTDRRLLRGERTRQTILEATLEVLGEQGAERMTAQSVAQRAGVSQGALFHHFHTVEDMVLDAGMVLFDRITAQVRESPGGGVSDYLYRLGLASLTALREQPALIRAFLALMEYLHDERFRGRVAAYYEQQVQHIASDMAELEPPVTDPRQAHDVAMLLTMLYDGMGVHWRIFEDIDELERFWERMGPRLVALAHED